MNVTLALRKKDAPILWLVGFWDETQKPLSILGIQLAAGPVLGLLSGCQGSWKVVVTYCANNKLFLCLRKANSNYRRSWLKTDVAGWRRKLFGFWLWKSQAAQHAGKHNIIELAGSVLTFLLPHWRQWALGRQVTFLTTLLSGSWVGWSIPKPACFSCHPVISFFLYWMASEGIPVRGDRESKVVLTCPICVSDDLTCFIQNCDVCVSVLF